MNQGQAAGTGNEPSDGLELPPAPTRQKKVWPWVLSALLALGVVSALTRAIIQSSETTPSAEERILGASESLTSHDFSVVYGLAAHVRRFNAASLPLINDYLDPTVSSLEWVRTAGNHITEMQGAVMAMEADILSVQDTGVRRTLQALAESLREELAAMIELRLAVADQDVRAAKAGLRHLRQAATQRAQLGEELLNRLRPFIDPETLQLILQAAAEGPEPQN